MQHAVVDSVLLVAIRVPIHQQGRQQMTAPLVRQVAMERMKERRVHHAVGLVLLVAMELGKERRVQLAVDLVQQVDMLRPQLRRQGRQRMTASLVGQVATELKEGRAEHALDFVLLVDMLMALRQQGRQRMTAPLVR